MARAHPQTISPTAHYTGYVWYAHGLSHPAFATPTGRRMYRGLRGPNLVAQRVGWSSLEGMLLARHRLIDLRLGQAIEAGEIEQIVEIACGLSPRGWRFRTRFGDRITYVEADLPGMLDNKRRILAQLGGETAHHRTAEVDALRDESVEALCATLDPARGTAILTEGLVNYFDRETTLAMWRRFGRALGRFPRGIYLSDLMLREDNSNVATAAFAKLLGVLVLGRVHMHFGTADDAERALDACGLDAVVHDPRDFAAELPGLETAGSGRVRVIEAVARR